MNLKTSPQRLIRVTSKGMTIGKTRVKINAHEMAVLFRAYLTGTPLEALDPRTVLVEDVRFSTIREDRPSGQKWIVIFKAA